MKKIILIASVIALAGAAIFAGSAFAQQTQTSPEGAGILHPYMVAALAEKLGLTVEDVEARITAGATMYQIALDEGIAAADAPVFLLEVRTLALTNAVADGVITQVQADWMLSRMQRSNQGVPGSGTCPMGSGTQQGGRGQGMMGGWRAQQANP